MRTTNRYDWVLLVLLGVAAAGCATFKNTPQQDYVWEAGRVCDRQVAFWKMDRVESNGHYWIQGATNGPPGRDDYFACMQEQFTRNPYQQWVAQRSGSQAPTPRAGGGGNARASTSASQPVTNSDASTKPTWRVGDEWSYRWSSPRGSGTFVWVFDRFETVEGIESAVVKSGERELFYRSDDGALHLEKIGGVVEIRNSPPLALISWPLEVGRKWTARYTREAVIARQTSDMLLDCRVEGLERVTVAAGAFPAFHVICLNQRSGTLSFELWYASEVGNMVKDRTAFSYGMRERELTGFKRAER